MASCYPLDCWRSFRAIQSLRRLRCMHDGRESSTQSAEFLRRRSYDENDNDDDEVAPPTTFSAWFVKSTVWLLCGLLSSSGFFYMAVDRSSDLFICIPAMIVVSLSVAFMPQVRYVALLALLHVCSGKGQMVFLAYIFIVATDGPLRNALSNLRVLFNSTVCLQHKMVDLLPPFLGDHLPDRRQESSGVFEDSRALANDTATAFRLAFVAMESQFNDTVGQLDRQYDWLTDKRKLCHGLKTRLDYAIDAFAGRLFDSWRVVAFTPWLPTTVQHTAKDIVRRGFQSACGYGHVDSYDLFGLKTSLRNRMNAIRDYVRRESDVDVHLDRRYSFAVNRSRSLSSVWKDIVSDVSKTFGWLSKALDVVSVTVGSTTVVVIIKAVLYRRKYRRSPTFDNHYLSAGLVRLDRRRRLLGLETVLPLRRFERFRYVTSTCSLRLVPSERKKFVADLLPWIVAMANVACYVAFDYVVHWFADTLSHYEGISMSIRASILPRVQVDGDGVVSSVLRGIVEAFDPFVVGGSGGSTSIDLTQCLPRPHPPDPKTHFRLGLLTVASLLTISVGTWLLRLRHVVASIYDPDMERTRAAWLHRTITVRRVFDLRNFGRNFLESYRRNPSHLATNFLDYVYLSRPRIAKLMRLLFGYRPSFCLVCGEPFDDGHHRRPMKCDNDGCKGVFCDECFGRLNYLCPFCAKPSDYANDMDEVSEEFDSSDDDLNSIDFDPSDDDSQAQSETSFLRRPTRHQ